MDVIAVSPDMPCIKAPAFSAHRAQASMVPAQAAVRELKALSWLVPTAQSLLIHTHSSTLVGASYRLVAFKSIAKGSVLNVLLAITKRTTFATLVTQAVQPVLKQPTV